jgi:hypothetical protein
MDFRSFSPIGSRRRAFLVECVLAVLLISAVWQLWGCGEGGGRSAVIVQGKVTSVSGATARAVSNQARFVRLASLFVAGDARAQSSTCAAAHMLACVMFDSADPVCAPVDHDTCAFTLVVVIAEGQHPVRLVFVDDANQNGHPDVGEGMADLAENLGTTCNGSQILIGDVDVDFTTHTARPRGAFEKNPDACPVSTPLATPTPPPGASPTVAPPPPPPMGTATKSATPGGVTATPTPSVTPSSTPTPVVTTFTFTCNGTDALPGQTPVPDSGSGTATINSSGSSYSGSSHVDGTSGGQAYSCDFNISNGQTSGNSFSDSFQATTPNCCSGTESGTCTTTQQGTDCTYSYQGTFSFQNQTGQCSGTCQSQSVTPTATPTATPGSATATPTPPGTPTSTPVSGDMISGFPILDDPSSLNDQAAAIATDGTYMYVVGRTVVTPLPTPGVTPTPSGDHDRAWRITKRRLDNGSLVAGFGDGGSGIITENPDQGRDSADRIVIDSTFMYVAGIQELPPFDKSGSEWRIEKRRLSDGALDPTFGNLGVVTSNVSSRELRPVIAKDDSFLYVAGIQFLTATDAQFRLEKRMLSDGSLVNTFGNGNGVAFSNPTALLDGATGIALDATSIYLIGLENGVLSGGTDHQQLTASDTRFEKRSKADGSLIMAFGTMGAVASTSSSGVLFPQDMVTDGTSLYAYELDGSPGNGNLQWQFEKRAATDGTLTASLTSAGLNPNDQMAGGLFIDGSSLYAAGIDGPPFMPVPSPTPAPQPDTRWRIEKRNLSDLTLVPSFGASGVVISDPSAFRDGAAGLAVDGGTLYVVGFDNLGQGDEWRIEARFK